MLSIPQNPLFYRSPYKNPGLEVYCYNFLSTFSVFDHVTKTSFLDWFIISLVHMIKNWAKQTNLYTQVRFVNNRKKQKASRPGFFIWTMILLKALPTKVPNLTMPMPPFMSRLALTLLITKSVNSLAHSDFTTLLTQKIFENYFNWKYTSIKNTSFEKS